MTTEATLRRPDVLLDLATRLRGLLTLIDQVSWGVSVRKPCPVCGAVAVEGHVGQGSYEAMERPCWIGQLRDRFFTIWQLYRRLSSEATTMADSLQPSKE